jgi:hypothetical protein
MDHQQDRQFRITTESERSAVGKEINSGGRTLLTGSGGGGGQWPKFPSEPDHINPGNGAAGPTPGSGSKSSVKQAESNFLLVQALPSRPDRKDPLPVMMWFKTYASSKIKLAVKL